MADFSWIVVPILLVAFTLWCPPLVALAAIACFLRPPAPIRRVAGGCGLLLAILFSSLAVVAPFMAGLAASTAVTGLALLAACLWPAALRSLGRALGEAVPLAGLFGVAAVLHDRGWASLKRTQPLLERFAPDDAPGWLASAGAQAISVAWLFWVVLGLLVVIRDRRSSVVPAPTVT